MEIIKTKFKTKIQTILETYALEDFYGGNMTIKAEFIIIVQKNQIKKLVLNDIKDNIEIILYAIICLQSLYYVNISMGSCISLFDCRLVK